MVNVELIYDGDCPNVERARAQLLGAFAEVDLEARWQEWERSDAKSPDYVRGYGSPTILVDGRDIAGTFPKGIAKCCRVYSNQSGEISGVPSLKAITSALLKAKKNRLVSAGAGSNHKRKWWASLGVFPVIGAVLLPGISCPACWPAYVALLSSIGVGFVNYTPYLLPLTLPCLAVVVFSLGFRARRRCGFGPLVLGSAAALIILTGKFILAWRVVTYTGVIFLVSACIWNLWPRKTISGDSCSDCVPAGAPQTKLEYSPNSKGGSP